MQKYKSLYLTILLVLSNILLLAQNRLIDSIPKDPLMSKACLIINRSNDFLIKDNVNYLCYIELIISLKNGYSILAHTQIDTFDIVFKIVTTNKSKKNSVEKIHMGGYYHLSLKRYYDFPVCAGIIAFGNRNIMINNKINHIKAPGSNSYFFVTDNLDGLEYIDSTVIEDRKKVYFSNKNAIDTLIDHFLTEISFSVNFDALDKYIDTNSTKKIFQNYCADFSVRNKRNANTYPYWFPFYRIKLLDWKSRGVNPKNYKEMLSYMLKTEYNLPCKTDSTDKNYSILKQDILNISEDFVYSIRVYWEIEECNDIYSIILSIKQTNNTFKIIGINAFGIPSKLKKIYRKES